MTKEKEIRFYEELSMNAWPAQESYFYDGWVLRFTEGYTKRANSINPLYSSSIDLDRKIKNCEAIYEEKGLPPIFKLNDYVYPRDLDSKLEERGYRKLDEVALQILDLENFSLKAYLPDQGIEVVFEEEMTEDWIQAYIECSDMKDAVSIGIMTNLLFCISKEVLTVRLVKGKKCIACAFSVCENHNLGVFDVITRKEFRRKGFARTLLIELLRYAKIKKIKTAYLQVVLENDKALALYKNLGFIDLYRYWYRCKEENSEC